MVKGMARIALLGAAAAAIAGCSDIPAIGDTTYKGKETQTSKQYNAGYGQPGDGGLMLFGPGGIFGGDSNNQGGGGGIGVNSYLWRASLDTLSFMPLSSADPFGGVIITDWYAPQDASDDRFKVNIYILDRQLRADGIRATVFRQRRMADGRWADSPVDAQTHTDLENAILTRARQLRISTAQK
jgi:hypothetical protein